MIEALTLQDPSKPIVFNMTNKKAGQNYMYNSSNDMEFGLPSISFGKKNTINSSKTAQVVIINEPTVQTDIKLPLKHLVCQGYILYAITLGITGVLLPYYVNTVAFFLTPLLCITILGNCIITQSRIHSLLGVSLIVIYPVLVYMNNTYLLISFMFIFIVFLLVSLLPEKLTYVYLSIVSLLVLCTFIGIIIYQVYPRSIHGVHASFLSLCLLTCTTIIISRKKNYKIVCEIPSTNVNAI